MSAGLDKKRRALKRTLFLAAVLLLFPYVAAYYHSWEFSDFVVQEARLARSTVQFKQSVLEKAHAISLAVSESDIRITTTGSVFRADIAYKVPVNMVFYKSHLQFQTIGSGLLRTTSGLD
jgi:hypothetical protein